MRSVRCNACGNKALLAASSCPKCGDLFAVRDGFGELLPLAYCPECESYYPERLGSCKWCGTKPERAPITPKIWKGIGAGALAVIVLIGWLLRDTGPKTAAHAQTTAQRRSTAAPTAVGTPVADSATARREVAMADSVERERVSGSTSPAPPAATVVSSGAIASTPAPSAPPAVAADMRPNPAANVPPATPAASRSSARWVASVTKNWVIVRAGPSKSSRLVASIGPKSRVQLGETQGDWRRIRARGVAGWVEPKSLFAEVPASKARELVSR